MARGVVPSSVKPAGKPPGRPGSIHGPDGPILHVISGLGVGGAEKMLTELVSNLQARGLEQYVVSLSSGGKYRDELKTVIGENCVELNVRQPADLFATVAKLRQLVRKARPAVIQGWMYHGDLFATIAYFLCFGIGKPGLYWGIRCSNIDLTEYSFQLRAVVTLCKLFSRLPGGIIANSMVGLRAHAEGGYRNPHFHHIPNCVNGDRYRPDPETRSRIRGELGIPPDRFVFLIVARVDPMKGFEIFLELAARFPDCIALAAGRGTEALAGPDNFRGLGMRDDVPALLNAADLLVSTSLFGEGQSNSLIEAMATGLPVLTSDTGDSAALVDKGGVIVPPGDLQGFVDGMAHLIGDGEERKKMAEENRRRILSDYSCDVMVDRFLTVYAGAEGASR